MDIEKKLNWIEERQKQLHEDVTDLTGVIALLRKELAEAGVEQPPAPPVADARQPAARAPVVPGPVMPPPLPVTAPKEAARPAPVRPPEPALEIPREESSKPPEEAFEMRFGRVWFVRLGVLLLLTGMVFLANHAYQEYVMNWGAFPRAMALFLGAGAMAVTGLRLEKRRPAMARFGQVLGAGGLAGVFYTLYASHYVEPLRWINSGLLTGGLLLAWTAFMVWIADRRKSQVLAGFSLLLAYYTCVITPVSGFLLSATLLLTAASIFFLIRNRWLSLSLGALPLTYGAFAFWQYYVAGSPGDPAAGLTAIGYLCGYWLAFSAASFLTRRGEMKEEIKAAWVALNNIALFALGAFSLPAFHGDQFWAWSLGLGGVLLALAYASRSLLADSPAVARVHLAQGLLLVTLGFIAKFSGTSLSLILIAESAGLLIASRYHWRTWYLTASFLTAGLGTLAGITAIESGDAQAVIAAMGGALILLGMGFAVRSHRGDSESGLSLSAIYFAVLAQALFGFAAHAQFSLPHAIVALAAVPLVAIATARFHGYREFALSALLMMAVGHLMFAVEWLEHGPIPTWPTVALLALTTAAGQLWLRQRTVTLTEENARGLQAWLSLAEVALAAAALMPLTESADWMAIGALLAVLFYAKGLFAGPPVSAVLGQMFLVVSSVTAIRAFATGAPQWFESLAPAVALAGIAAHVRCDFSAPAAFGKSLSGQFMRQLATTLYPAAALVMLGLWTLHFADNDVRPLALAAIGSALLASTIWRPGRFAIAGWLAYAAAALLAMVWARAWGDPFTGYAACTLLLLLGGQHFIHGRAEEEAALIRSTASVAVAALLMGWWMLTDAMAGTASGLFLTVGWCVYGAVVFGAGLLIRRRAYRLTGLAVLGAAFARLIFIDVWAYGTLARTLSALALGFVLICLGFIYNRFADALKRIL